MRVCVYLLAALLASPAVALPWHTGTGKGGRAGKAPGLKEGVAAFKSYKDCIEQLGRRLPGEMALWTQHDRGPLELVCRSREAASLDDPSVCRQSLTGYRERQQCQRFYAIFKGRPKDCPRRGWPSYHEELCLALAARDPILCHAAPAKEQGLCRALLLGRRHCSALASPQRARCRRATEVWREVLKPGARKARHLRPRLELRATPLTGGANLPAGAASFKAPALDHGILLADQPGTGDWLIFDRRFAPQESYSYSARPPLQLQLKIPLPGGGTGQVTLGGAGNQGTASAQIPGRTYGRTRTFEARSGSVTITSLDRRRTGQVSGSLDLVLTDGVDRIQLRGRFETFVRELVPLSQVASYVRSRSRPGTGYASSGTLPADKVARLVSRIYRVREGLYHVDPSVRAEIVADTTTLTRSASISRLTGGARSGFKLYRVHRNNLLWLLGFRDQDVVQQVNGKNLDTREDIYTAFVRYRRAARLVVTVERGGKARRLTYLVRRVRRRARPDEKRAVGKKKAP